MKGKRLKNVQKTLLFYKLHFGIDAPYRLLVDGTLCNTAYSNHINLAEQIPKLFQAHVRIFTTKCAISEVEGLQARFGVSRGTSLSILHQFPVIPCHHPLAGNVKDCFSSKYKYNTQDTDKNKFCVGTQDQELREHARKSGGVPIFTLKSRVPCVEPPSDYSKSLAEKQTVAKAVPEHSKKVIAGIKKDQGAEESGEIVKKRKRKGPNPLSQLKKKRKTLPSSPKTDGKKARKRKRHHGDSKQEDISTLIKNLT
ncbi:hypothetical protein EB796_001729 [Bugula neritina]|uniref:UTP23 n=1 Tax=Bugula neritina TaxID=10212 RepID=A0A7J7KP81_BUGNE|nr:hypothetical protein EB796_001729 [Bugula neritina]